MASNVAALDFCYLTTTGRVTGTSHRIEVWFAIRDETVFLMAGDRDRSDWVRNLMVTPDVELELGGRKRVTRARVVDESSDDDAAARRLMLEKYEARDGGDLSEWGRTALVVAVDWPGGVSYTSLI
ncbi:MAG: nitroreductase/quinone reductase family protein [Actinomycetota bacterium]|nr:nitroreductase/quinone reductase family protein [Actinomycetota bacterium]MDH5224744.1 nitroreductase/quinone reductase family protein [Actinomycetota bacterium]MDH5314101.1 nitroreductase/quinone reductase family protein [Actinomycetota bacterium]